MGAERGAIFFEIEMRRIIRRIELGPSFEVMLYAVVVGKGYWAIVGWLHLKKLHCKMYVG